VCELVYESFEVIILEKQKIVFRVMEEEEIVGRKGVAHLTCFFQYYLVWKANFCLEDFSKV
jgi:hypothetical protein